MAFKVAGRHPSGGAKAPPSSKSAANHADQSSFAFKSTSSTPASGPKAPPSRPPAPGPVQSQARRPAPSTPSKPSFQPVRADNTRWHGRSEPPPPRGSSYAEYAEWAADGLIPDEYTAALALDYYLGHRPDDPEEAPAFRP